MKKSEKLNDDPSIDLAFKIIALAAEYPGKVDLFQAMAVAYVGLIAGPDQKIDAESLAFIIQAIGEEAFTWNKIFGNENTKKKAG